MSAFHALASSTLQKQALLPQRAQFNLTTPANREAFGQEQHRRAMAQPHEAMGPPSRLMQPTNPNGNVAMPSYLTGTSAQFEDYHRQKGFPAGSQDNMPMYPGITPQARPQQAPPTQSAPQSPLAAAYAAPAPSPSVGSVSGPSPVFPKWTGGGQKAQAAPAPYTPGANNLRDLQVPAGGGLSDMGLRSGAIPSLNSQPPAAAPAVPAMFQGGSLGQPTPGMQSPFQGQGTWNPSAQARPTPPPATSYQALGQQGQPAKSIDYNSQFRTVHGGAFDPNSRVDREKMQQMQQWGAANPGASSMTPNTFARNFNRR